MLAGNSLKMCVGFEISLTLILIIKLPPRPPMDTPPWPTCSLLPFSPVKSLDEPPRPPLLPPLALLPPPPPRRIRGGPLEPRDLSRPSWKPSSSSHSSLSLDWPEINDNNGKVVQIHGIFTFFFWHIGLFFKEEPLQNFKNSSNLAKNGFNAILLDKDFPHFLGQI